MKDTKILKGYLLGLTVAIILSLVFVYRPKQIKPPWAPKVYNFNGVSVTNEFLQVGKGVIVPMMMLESDAFTNIQMYGHIDIGYTNSMGAFKTNRIYFNHAYWIEGLAKPEFIFESKP